MKNQFPRDNKPANLNSHNYCIKCLNATNAIMELFIDGVIFEQVMLL